jgi:tetratricopeptide (TPR) repeat protein
LRTRYPIPGAFWIITVLLCLPCSAILGLAPENALQRAQSKERSGKLQEAIAAYQKIVVKEPHSVEAQAGLGRVYYRSGQFHEAASSFERALDIQPGAPEILRWLGKCYLRENEPQKVIALFPERGEGQDPVWIHMLRARAYDAQDLTKQAIAELERALALQPRLPEAHFAIGFIKWSIGDLAGAEKEFRDELAIDPGHPASRFYLSEVLTADGRTEEADKILKKLAEDAPGTYFAQFGLGKMAERQNDPKAAADHFRRAVEMEPNSAETHYHLAVALRKLGRIQEASEEFHKSRDLQSSSERGLTPHGMGGIRPKLPDFDE